MNTSSRTVNMVIIAVLAAILVVMALTPLGYLNVGPLAITFLTVPVAIGAIVVGPVGGLILGAVFGLTSFLQAAGVVGVSPLGSLLFSVNPFFTFVLCVGARTLDGFVIGVVCDALLKVIKVKVIPYGITGFLAAALNTVFFMTLIVVLFKGTLVDCGFWAAGKNVFAFIAGFVGINAVVEAGVGTVITAAIAFGLYKAGLIKRNLSVRE